MKHVHKIILPLIFCVGLLGCGTVDKILPANSAVLVCPTPFNETYSRVLEILRAQPDWRLQSAEMEKGSIGMRSLLNCGPLDTSESCTVMLSVKTMDETKTSVSIAKSYQRVDGGDGLLMAVKDGLGCETQS